MDDAELSALIREHAGTAALNRELASVLGTFPVCADS